MDTDEQTTLAKIPDPKLAAGIVLNIANLERDYQLAQGPLSVRLLDEVAQALQDVVPEEWQIIGSDWEVYLTSPDWKSTRGSGRGDAWLELGDLIEDPAEHSWIAVAVTAGPTQMCLELKLRKGLATIAECFKASPQLGTTLVGHGFGLTHGGTRFHIPISIEAKHLAKSFETDKFDEALKPMRQAGRQACNAKQELDDLVGLARTLANKK